MFLKLSFNFFNIIMVLCMSCNIFSPKDCKLTSQKYNKFCTKPELAGKFIFETFFQVSGCNITELGKKLFKGYYQSSVDLSNNNISIVRSYTFTNLSIVSILLRNNNIEILEIKAFYNVSLTFLELSENNIFTLNTTAFFNVHLNNFIIENSSITIIRNDSLNFLNFQEVSFINMRYNRIQYFDPDCLANKSILFLNLSKYPVDMVQRVCEKNYNVYNILKMCDGNIIPFIISYGILSCMGIILLALYLTFRFNQNNVVSSIFFK